jgi:hypothetical protein
LERNKIINITNIFPIIPIKLSILDMIKNGISNQRGNDSNSGNKESIEVKLVIILISNEIKRNSLLFFLEVWLIEKKRNAREVHLSLSFFLSSSSAQNSLHYNAFLAFN